MYKPVYHSQTNSPTMSRHEYAGYHALIEPSIDKKTLFMTADYLDKANFQYCAKNVHKCTFEAHVGVGVHLYVAIRGAIEWLRKNGVQIVRIKGNTDKVDCVQALF